MRTLLALGFTAFLAACGGGGTLTATESINNSCPNNPTQLTGTKASGATCTAATDCSPACCNCMSGSKSYLGAACIDGKCAASAATCDATTSACN